MFIIILAIIGITIAITLSFIVYDGKKIRQQLCTNHCYHKHLKFLGGYKHTCCWCGMTKPIEAKKVEPPKHGKYYKSSGTRCGGGAR